MSTSPPPSTPPVVVVAGDGLSPFESFLEMSPDPSPTASTPSPSTAVETSDESPTPSPPSSSGQNDPFDTDDDDAILRSPDIRRLLEERDNEKRERQQSRDRIVVERIREIVKNIVHRHRYLSRRRRSRSSSSTTTTVLRAPPTIDTRVYDESPAVVESVGCDVHRCQPRECQVDRLLVLAYQPHDVWSKMDRLYASMTETTTTTTDDDPRLLAATTTTIDDDDDESLTTHISHVCVFGVVDDPSDRERPFRFIRLGCGGDLRMSIDHQEPTIAQAEQYYMAHKVSVNAHRTSSDSIDQHHHRRRFPSSYELAIGMRFLDFQSSVDGSDDVPPGHGGRYRLPDPSTPPLARRPPPWINHRRWILNNLFACRQTGTIHVCGPQQCLRRSSVEDRTDGRSTCQLTGLTLSDSSDMMFGAYWRPNSVISSSNSNWSHQQFPAAYHLDRISKQRRQDIRKMNDLHRQTNAGRRVEGHLVASSSSSPSPPTTPRPRRPPVSSSPPPVGGVKRSRPEPSPSSTSTTTTTTAVAASPKRRRRQRVKSNKRVKWYESSGESDQDLEFYARMSKLSRILDQIETVKRERHSSDRIECLMYAVLRIASLFSQERYAIENEQRMSANIFLNERVRTYAHQRHQDVRDRIHGVLERLGRSTTTTDDRRRSPGTPSPPYRATVVGDDDDGDRSSMRSMYERQRQTRQIRRQRRPRRRRRRRRREREDLIQPLHLIEIMEYREWERRRLGRSVGLSPIISRDSLVNIIIDYAQVVLQMWVVVVTAARSEIYHRDSVDDSGGGDEDDEDDDEEVGVDPIDSRFLFYDFVVAILYLMATGLDYTHRRSSQAQTAGVVVRTTTTTGISESIIHRDEMLAQILPEFAMLARLGVDERSTRTCIEEVGRLIQHQCIHLGISPTRFDPSTVDLDSVDQSIFKPIRKRAHSPTSTSSSTSSSRPTTTTKAIDRLSRT